MAEPAPQNGSRGPLAPPPGAPDKRAFAWFSAGVASWFGAWGMQGVLFSWLVVGELKAPAEWVGLAQTSSMLPSLALLLVGGAAADRVDTRRLLILLHVLAAIPVLALAAVVASGQASLGSLIAFGLCIGTLSAFAMPARDTLLSRVAGEDMMRAVTTMTAAQFGAQALGTLVAGAARIVGTAPMLLVQALVLLTGSLTTLGVPPAPPKPRTAHASPLHEITAGLPVVARTPKLRSPFILVFCVGLFFVGPFMVCFPLMVRDIYGGDALSLALVLMLFPVGTIIGSLLIRARGGIRRKGLAAILALFGGATALSLISLHLPFAAMLAATLTWGLCGSVFINCSRTLFQEASPSDQRARVLAIYQLGFMGAGPIGALLAGALSAEIGTLGALRAFAAAMFVVVCVVALTTDTARME